jgi:hypothetical protein
MSPHAGDGTDTGKPDLSLQRLLRDDPFRLRDVLIHP